ncbi:hypothetical protein M6I34_06055 [Burkholderiaceae bacterium FT117]|uniref:hypothetical protein n=1 Tax=Zeimonas sediminis TaxID=2944268 RepID=UPI00234321B0|nr:hypothetical protein [Zeimonas sediminis]MCM5570064.1 hypothetical protein [Zeimonas sediminis]
MKEFLMFAAGAAIGGLLSWLITHRYYIKAGADQRAELDRLSADLRPRNTLENFERMLESSNWTKSVIDHTEVWIADADNTYQIEIGERTREFTERWTTVHPDPNSSAYPVYLKLNGATIKELTFIAMDGGRIFVPMAGVRQAGANEVEYFWNLNSLEVKVCRIIGAYYLYENLEGVATRSKVAIVA